MGVPIKNVEGRRWVVAVVCPVASRVTEDIRKRLATVLIVVASERERQRLQGVCSDRQRFHLIPEGSVPPASPSSRASQPRRGTDDVVRKVHDDLGWR